MDHDRSHGRGMPSMEPSSSIMNMNMNMNMNMMMHMAFFWDNKNTEILFSGWPGTNTGMYYLSLFLVFILAFGVEWVSRCSFIKKPGVARSEAVVGMMRTLMHTIRMGLAYLVMLAVMSFNGGVFIAALAGHGMGFLVFGTRIWKKSRRGGGGGGGGTGSSEVDPELPPMSC